MKLAFYKAFQEKATIIDKLIGIASVGKYSHVELIFDNGLCFSVSGRDGAGRFKKIKFNPDRWDILELDDRMDPVIILREANKYVGYKYDYLGAFFSVTPICIQKDNKIFCSEVVINMLNKSMNPYRLKDGCNYSPSRLHNEIKKYIGTKNV